MSTAGNPVRSLTVVIPAYNEGATIHRVIEAVCAADFRGLRLEVVVIDDGSTDSTYEQAVLAQQAQPADKVGGIRIVRLPKNGGKGNAVREGFRVSTGDLVIVQDADLEYDPIDIGRMIDEVLKGRADVVIGSRFIGGRPRRVIYLSNALGNRFMSGLFSILSGLPLSDIHCCYMLFPGPMIRAAAEHLQSARWGFNPEICSVLADWRNDLSIVELGISYYGRSKAEGKQIRMRHGVVAVAEIVKFNLRRRLPTPPAVSSMADRRTVGASLARPEDRGLAQIDQAH